MLAMSPATVVKIEPQIQLLPKEAKQPSSVKATTQPGFIKRFSYGVLAGLAKFPINSLMLDLSRNGTSLFSQMPDFSKYFFTKIALAEIQILIACLDLSNLFDETTINSASNASCPMKAIASRILKYQNITINELNLSQKVFRLKIDFFLVAVVVGPILEELLFRDLVQDVLLTRIPKYIISKISPGHESLVDSKIAALSRIALTAAAFSASHLFNYGIIENEYVKIQVITTFFNGLIYGLVRESRAGLTGTIAAHMTNNLFASLPILWAC